MSTYRNGTYVAFHGGDTTNPTASSIRYYNTLKMWKANGNIDFTFVDSHEKTSPVRDSSLQSTRQARLAERLRNSKHMLLIIDRTTRNDTDNVLFEIDYAMNTCKIPIIGCYPEFEWVLDPKKLRHLWPDPLRAGVDAGTARMIHIPFALPAISDALSQFHVSNPPNHALACYTETTYRRWGIIR